jgi:hypothetical protein
MGSLAGIAKQQQQDLTQHSQQLNSAAQQFIA